MTTSNLWNYLGGLWTWSLVLPLQMPYNGQESFSLSTILGPDLAGLSGHRFCYLGGCRQRRRRRQKRSESCFSPSLPSPPNCNHHNPPLTCPKCGIVGETKYSMYLCRNCLQLYYNRSIYQSNIDLTFSLPLLLPSLQRLYFFPAVLLQLLSFSPLIFSTL